VLDAGHWASRIIDQKDEVVMSTYSRYARELTMDERLVLQQTAEGRTANEIAGAAFCSEATVKECRKRIYRKLNAKGAAHAVLIGMREGLIS